MRKEIQWNFNWYWSIFIQENAFENVVCEMASILSRPQCDNGNHNTSTTASSYGMGTLAPHNTPHNTPCLYGGYLCQIRSHPDSKVHGANMWPIWGRLDPGGPHVGPMNSRFMGPTCGPSGADRTQVGPMLAQWTLLSGQIRKKLIR